MAITPINVKTFANGVKVFSQDFMENGIKKVRTTAYDSEGKLICDRLKTLSNFNSSIGKGKTVTKHYFGENALGEAYTRGAYNVTSRVYGQNGLEKILEMHTTPAYLEKYGTWHGSINYLNGGQPNSLNNLKTYFDYDARSLTFSNLSSKYGGAFDLPTRARIDGADCRLLENMSNRLNYLDLNV